jgi:cytochrome d ubiquinol oxidase subunit II
MHGSTISAPTRIIISDSGALIVLPCIIGYTIFAYRVFWGKVKELTYY